jgi:hypothetical protein
MSVLAVSSQTVLTYLGYLLQLGTISVNSLQTSLSLINAVHNDFEYLSPECGYLVKLVRKGFAELCMCLTDQFVFFSRADSGVLLTVINDQVSDSTLSINQTVKNVVHNQVAPSSRVSSTQDDPENYFNKLQFHWKTLRDHRDTDLYWFFDDDLRLYTRTQTLSPSGCCTSCWSSTFQLLQVHSTPGLGLMEVSRFIVPLHRRLCASVFRSSLLLRTPACVFQSSVSATRSTKSTYCCESVDRPERRFGRVARV